MHPVVEEVKLLAAICIATLTKWLLTEKGPDPDETPLARKRRFRQAIGGILAGILIAYYGHDRVIAHFDRFTSDDRVLVAIVLAFTGEHLVRAFIGAVPHLIEKWVEKFGGGKT